MRVEDDVSLDALHRYELFDGLDADELATVAEFVERRIYESDEHIVDEGEHSRDMFVLTDGQIDVLKSDSEGELQQLAVLEPEAILGELGLILAEPRSATAVAAGEAHLLRFDGERLVGQRRDDALVAYKIEHNILRSLARRQTAMNTRMMDVLERSPDSEFELDEITDLRQQLTQNWSF